MSFPSYNALRAFEVVVRLGSIKAACEELHVTQSAISHQLRQLEEALDLPLLQRNGRSVQPTAAGQILSEGLQDGFARLHAAVRDVAHKAHVMPLMIACLPSVAARWLVPRLALFRQKHPDTQLRIHYSGRNNMITQEQTADVVITWLDGDYHGNGNAWCLFNGATYPVCSPLYLDRFGPILKPEDLLKADLLHDETTSPWRAWFHNHTLAAPQHENETVYEDFNLMSFAVLAGHGVALAPLTLLRPELEQGLLVPLFDTPVNVQRHYWLIVPARHRPEAVQFAHWVIQEAEITTTNSF